MGGTLGEALVVAHFFEVRRGERHLPRPGKSNVGKTVIDDFGHNPIDECNDLALEILLDL